MSLGHVHGTVKRHQAYRQHYRQHRDLDHLSPEELSERLHTCWDNIRTRTERSKIGVLPVDSKRLEYWLVVFTETCEECRLRGYGRQGPIEMAPFAENLEHALDPIPDMESALEGRDPAASMLFKFGDPKWLKQALDVGRIRICPASFYEDDAHNHARKDTERERFLRPNPRSPHHDGSDHRSVRCASDYFLYSVSSHYDPRLFGDFHASACMVINDPAVFLERVAGGIRKALPRWRTELRVVSYFDPVRADPATIDVEVAKPFRHAYQSEVRVISTPPKARSDLQPFEVEIGSLRDCARVIDLDSHPPREVPHDPADDPIRVFGFTHPDATMARSLPSVQEVQGVTLNKEQRSPVDWYFDIEYADTHRHLNRLRISVPQALHLMKLLKSADKEQHLSFLNDALSSEGW